MSKTNFYGWLIILLGFVIGCATVYGALWWAIVGSFVDFIGYCKADEISKIGILWCVIKFFFLSSVIGSIGAWITFFVTAFGIACAADKKKPHPLDRFN